MAFIQHLYGIRSMRQTVKEIEVNVAYRWFLHYDFSTPVPHFATVSYAFANRFPAEVFEGIFKWILKDNNDKPSTPSQKEITVSTTNPESGLFHKGEHKVVFAYCANTACDANNYVVDFSLVPGNINDSTKWLRLKFAAMNLKKMALRMA